MHSSEIGDCIGVESSTDFKSDVDAPQHCGGRHKLRSRRLAAEKKQYPPPISRLSRTENLQSHMPCVMKKYCTDDGRLIIREERVTHHEYFLADRSDGRLVLNLVHLDDVVEETCEETHAPKEDSAVGGFSDEKMDNGDEVINDKPEEEMVSECAKYKGVGVKVQKPCAGFVAATEIFRPQVHT